MFKKYQGRKKFNKQKVTQANRIQKHSKTKSYFHHFTNVRLYLHSKSKSNIITYCQSAEPAP
jgi:hypothetical protein